MLRRFFGRKRLFSPEWGRTITASGGDIEFEKRNNGKAVSEQTTILLVDDHAIVREGLRMLLKRDLEVLVVGEASNGREALEKVEELQPQVVLMDLSMPVLDGVSATEQICARYPETRVIALTSVLEDNAVVRAVKAGAVGYVLKDSRSDILRAAIQSVAAGRVYLAPEAAQKLVEQTQQPEAVDELTEREFGVLKQLAFGLTNREIAEVLKVGEETVKTHVSHILSKLSARSRTEAALVAWQRGWIDRSSS